MHLVMFDIDGTLVQSLAVDSHCFEMALRDAADIQGFDPDWSTYSHITDSYILNHLFFIRHGRIPESRDIKLFQNTYCSYLKQARLQSPDLFNATPGAAKVLSDLRQDPRFAVCIATGGRRQSAEFKLACARLAVENIPFASAEDGVSREEIMNESRRRSEEFYKKSFSGVTYIGDGTHDLKASKNLNYNFIGIGYGERETQLRLAGAKNIFCDFNDGTIVQKILENA
jgi:phosphoglycolate phosphatase-like HAD superfamily hydrolase